MNISYILLTIFIFFLYISHCSGITKEQQAKYEKDMAEYRKKLAEREKLRQELYRQYYAREAPFCVDPEDAQLTNFKPIFKLHEDDKLHVGISDSNGNGLSPKGYVTQVIF